MHWRNRGPNARLLKAAWESYDKAFGENAIAAAESDSLDRAIRIINTLVNKGCGKFGTDEWFAAIRDAKDFVATTTHHTTEPVVFDTDINGDPW